MKKNHTPRGKKIAIGLIALVFGSVATVAIRDSSTGNRHGLTAKLGTGLNQALLAASKFGMGLSEMHDEFLSASDDRPDGMIAVTEATEAKFSRPDGLLAKGEPSTFLAKQSKNLHQTSRGAYISAKKVEIYAGE